MIISTNIAFFFLFFASEKEKPGAQYPLLFFFATLSSIIGKSISKVYHAAITGTKLEQFHSFNAIGL